MSWSEWAKEEVRRAGLLDEDSDYGGEAGKAVLELVEVFARQGHSGGSAASVARAFGLLANHQVLTPLTGEDDEWIEVRPGVEQNRRCPRVFREKGQAYDIEAVVFIEPSGETYTSRNSSRPVMFPYTPHTVFRPAEEDVVQQQ